MIFTFQEHNSVKRYLMFAENKKQAFKEIQERMGPNAKYFSLVAYTPVEKFAMFI